MKTKTSFEKGKSGNPGGRPKVDIDWKAWCTQFTKDNREHIAMEALSDNRLLTFICEQAHGRATQKHEVEGDVKLRLVLDKVAEAVRGSPLADKVIKALEAIADE